jgi:hypothetical protein
MLKATHKRRATTLSKTLLTAGLLGGAALSTLGAGSAQAAWTPDPGTTPTNNSYSCTFGGAVLCEIGDPTLTPPADGATGIVVDKKLTLLDWDSIADGSTLEFKYQTPDPHPWHVDLDLDDNDTNGGFLMYTVEITDPDPDQVFVSAFLGGLLQSNNPDVNKQIFSDSTFTTKICDITIGPFASQTCDISGKQIWVKDTWQAGAGVDSIANDYQQVPAPLPLLGAGAAFGSIRKLRKFSSQLKTFSMG